MINGWYEMIMMMIRLPLFSTASAEINLTCCHKVSQRWFDLTYGGFLTWTSLPFVVFLTSVTSNHIDKSINCYNREGKCAIKSARVVWLLVNVLTTKEGRTWGGIENSCWGKCSKFSWSSIVSISQPLTNVSTDLGKAPRTQPNSTQLCAKELALI